MKRLLAALLVPVALTCGASAQDQNTAPRPGVKLVMLTLLVKDYDEASKWYSDNLGFVMRDNKDMRPGKRWVAMYSADSPSLQIVLHQPGNGYMPVDKELSSDRIGKETFWILHTTDFDAMVKRLHDGGVRFRSETYPLDTGGKEIVFEDLYGNLWVLQQASKY